MLTEEFHLGEYAKKATEVSLQNFLELGTSLEEQEELIGKEGP